MTPERVLRDYFHAKDENRPHLLSNVFAHDAHLEINNRSAEIQFPSMTRGIEAIADVLVRRFNQTYENIYSFYMSRPGENDTEFSCDWLVSMSEKESQSIRVGCGRYDWTFLAAPMRLATRLVIAIDQMLVLPPEAAMEVRDWLLRLSYPWASAAIVKSTPHPFLVEPIVEYLVRDKARLKRSSNRAGNCRPPY